MHGCQHRLSPFSLKYQITDGAGLESAHYSSLVPAAEFLICYAALPL